MTRRTFDEMAAAARDELDIARWWDDRDDEPADASCACGGTEHHAYHRDTGWTCPREMRAEKGRTAA